MYFKDRPDAGKKLADQLKKYKKNPETVVIALPRGGLVTGYEVAKKLKLPLDIIVSKKIGAPGDPELAIGSVNMDGQVLIDQDQLNLFNISQDYIDQQAIILKKEIKQKLIKLRGTGQIPSYRHKTVIVVDDGVATGYTMKAAINYLKKQPVKKIVLAVPVGPSGTIEALKKEVDDLICLSTPAMFMAVGAFYENFEQITDEECRQLLKKAKK
ncbi:MAG TPA: phosphoribosyltransferase [Patescibacteria group bacterium]